MPQVVQAHPLEPGAPQERLEVLCQPRSVDGVPARRDEDEAIVVGGIGPLTLLTIEVRSEAVQSRNATSSTSQP